MASFFASLFRRAPQPNAHISAFPYNIKTNPYRSKRTWPPDFTKLSQKHQFRLERRYRRRTKLKWARPTWTKAVTLAQWGAIIFVVGYGTMYLEVEGGRTVFDGIRGWYQDQTGGDDGSLETKTETTLSTRVS